MTIPADESVPADKWIAAALGCVGDEYEWDGKAPPRLDCSGLVSWSGLQAGLAFVPNQDSTEVLATMGRYINPANPANFRRGDMLFPQMTPPLGHVQLFLGSFLVEYAEQWGHLLPPGQSGNNWIVEAPAPGLLVRISPQWANSYSAVRRVVPVTPGN
jgi:peptidoglycan DL-endopeptidase CwlO